MFPTVLAVPMAVCVGGCCATRAPQTCTQSVQYRSQYAREAIRRQRTRPQSDSRGLNLPFMPHSGDDNPFDWQQLLLREHEHLQGVIDKFDGHRFQIRNWAITATGAVFAVSLSTNRPAVAAGGIVIVILFWIVEGIYMNTTSAVISRSNHLERIIAAYRQDPDAPVDYTFGLGETFLKGQFKLGDLVRVLFTISNDLTAFYIGLVGITALGAAVAR